MGHVVSPDEFADRVAIVTGAASGIGRASARRFAAGGARVAILDRDAAGAVAAAEEIRQDGGSARAFECDVADEEAVEEAVRAVLSQFGPVTLAHINAATMSPGGDLTQISLEQWDRTFAVNCRGAFLTARAILPGMVEAGGGAMCFTGSDTALRTPAVYPAYLATKHAVIGIARSIAVDFGERKVRSNVVTPGVTATPGLMELYSSDGRNPHDVVADNAALSLLGRIATPEDVAEAAAFLCSDRAPFITGANLVVDGGMTVRYDAE